MKEFYKLSLFLLLISGTVVNAEENKSRLFFGMELSGVSNEESKILMEASEDFLAVLEGKKPIHAKVDNEALLSADGGTSYYLGDGYTLTISKSLSTFGSLHGYVYGPIITFEKDFALGNTSTLSNTRFYSPQALNKLLKY